MISEPNLLLKEKISRSSDRCDLCLGRRGASIQTFSSSVKTTMFRSCLEAGEGRDREIELISGIFYFSLNFVSSHFHCVGDRVDRPAPHLSVTALEPPRRPGHTICLTIQPQIDPRHNTHARNRTNPHKKSLTEKTIRSRDGWNETMTWRGTRHRVLLAAPEILRSRLRRCPSIPTHHIPICRKSLVRLVSEMLRQALGSPARIHHKREYLLYPVRMPNVRNMPQPGVRRQRLYQHELHTRWRSIRVNFIRTPIASPYRTWKPLYIVTIPPACHKGIRQLSRTGVRIVWHDEPRAQHTSPTHTGINPVL